MPLVVVAGPTSDPNCRVYHTRFEISTEGLQGSRGDPSKSTLSALGSMVLRMDGIIHVVEQNYMLMVMKAPLFSWDEVEPPIVNLLLGVSDSNESLRNDALLNRPDDLYAVGSSSD